MGSKGDFRNEQSVLGMMESFLWDKVIFRCTLDDSAEAIDAFQTPWSELKLESQLDFYGDVHLEFVNCQQVTLCDCLIPGKCVDAEELCDIASPGNCTGIKISLVCVDQSLPNIFVIGGRTLHGPQFKQIAEQIEVNVISIPSMRWRETSLVACVYEVDLARVVRNFDIQTDALVFSESECAHMDHVCARTSHQVMRSFWTTWLLFCRISKRLSLGNQNYQMAILPRIPGILDDVRLGGFKHQFEVSCFSCAIGIPMPDGRVLSEKIVLRSTILRAQDYSQNECPDHAHATRCGIRRTCYTGLNTLVNVIAWDLRTASALSQSELVEDVESSKCACAVRISLCSRQRRHKSLQVSREMHHVVTKDGNLRVRSRHTREILQCDEKTDINMSSRMCRTVESFSKLLTTGLDPSRACGLVTGSVPDLAAMAAASSQGTSTGYPEFHLPAGKKETAMFVCWYGMSPTLQKMDQSTRSCESLQNYPCLQQTLSR